MAGPNKDAFTEPAAHPAHFYEIPTVRESVLIPAGQPIKVHGWYRCPRCGNPLAKLTHGERVACSDCDLGVTLHGNGFTLDGSAP